MFVVWKQFYFATYMFLTQDFKMVCLGVPGWLSLLSVQIFFVIFFNVYLFLRDRTWVGGGQRERGTEDLKQSLCWEQRARCGAGMNYQIMTWANDLSQSQVSDSWCQLRSWSHSLEIKPHIGLCADSTEPTGDSLSSSPSAPPPALSLSLKIKIKIKIK